MSSNLSKDNASCFKESAQSEESMSTKTDTKESLEFINFNLVDEILLPSSNPSKTKKDATDEANRSLRDAISGPDLNSSALKRKLTFQTSKEFLVSEEQKTVCEDLLRALDLRRRYMVISLQSFPGYLIKNLQEASAHLAVDFPSFNLRFKEEMRAQATLKVEEGVFNVFISQHQKEEAVFQYPSATQYYKDLKFLCTMVTDGPTKSFCYRRLRYLYNQFELHQLLNEMEEYKEQIRIPHRDFYNIRKVDTHVHLASCMNQKHLLQFIKKKLKSCGDEVVIHRDGKDLTLMQVFDSLNLTPYVLSVDTLDMHADRNTFHRFDRFNLKYNPIGESRLREIFLKTDNKVGGRYFAELVREVISDLEETRFQKAEYRASIYGKSINEWHMLADWLTDNNMFSESVNWMIQIPRLYNVYHKSGLISNFMSMLSNIFRPLFEVTLNPNSNLKLYNALLKIGGFDCVDDESKPEISLHRLVSPEVWNKEENPPYSYYLYYLYANICVLNQLRASMGLNVFQFRPHCGEAGPLDHLMSAFLTAESISHGILLRKMPVGEYLYYLSQMGIAMSPLSNNSLFLEVNRNPMPSYFGLNISLSSDDPLQFHLTREALMEEYSVVAQIWKLSVADLCELAKNSVTQSGFPMELKRNWLGNNFEKPGEEGNDISKTNVPNIRVAFRHETLLCEWKILLECLNLP